MTEPFITEAELLLVSNGVLLLRRMAADFWLHADRPAEGCWEWHGNRDARGGYGIYGRKTKAHRMAYELTVGPIPDGLLILHSCDNPPCVRPAHLRAGTMAENMADMVARGRARFGGRVIGTDGRAVAEGGDAHVG